MDVFEAIKTRRSIRRYKHDPIDDKTLQTVLEAAHWAPSWGNNQCWRFVIVHDARIRSQIADTLVKIKIDDEWVENAASDSIKEAPVLIVICAVKSEAGCGPDGAAVTDKGNYWFMFDVALAMQNLTLAAHASGLGTVIIGAFDSVRVENILGIPDGCTVVAMTPLGFPDIKGQVSPRKRLSDVIYTDTYGKK